MIADPVYIRMHSTLRAMTNGDLDDVLAIERSSFDNPWSRNNFLDEFQNSDLSVQFVLEIDRKVIAYSVIWVVLDECHLANIAVHPDFRRLGISEILVKKIIETALEKKCAKIMLEVRRSNEPAIELYRKFQFEKVGLRKGYYHDGFMNSEDAILMDLDLTRGAKS